jgi:hypothetical protein
MLIISNMYDMYDTDMYKEIVYKDNEKLYKKRYSFLVHSLSFLYLISIYILCIYIGRHGVRVTRERERESGETNNRDMKIEF